MPTKTTIKRRTAARKLAGDAVENDDQYEDLDLSLEQDSSNPRQARHDRLRAMSAAARAQRSQRSQAEEEDDIVFDRRRGVGTGAAGAAGRGNDVDADDMTADVDDAMLMVHPRDAHHDAREGVRGAFAGTVKGQKTKIKKSKFDADDDAYGDDEDVDEAALATMMSRKERRRMADEDFDLGGGLSGSVLPPEAPVQPMRTLADQQQDAAILQVNSVAGKFAALSASERLQLIKKQSPEVEKLMQDLEKNLAEVRDVFAPLRSALFERKKAMQSAGDSMLLEFLETKVQLMLSYCVHILFFLLLKVEGAKVEGHPVLKRLVELRVYMERLHPVELRLQHSIQRLLSGEVVEGARLARLRPVDTGLEEGAGGGAKFAARKTAPVIDDLRQRRRQEALADQMRSMEHEEERMMSRKRMTRAEAAKFSGALEQVPVDAEMREEEDQFLASATSFLKSKNHGDDDDDDDDDDNDGNAGMSLIEKLRARKRAAEKQQAAPAAADAAASAAVSRVDLVAGNNNKKQQKEKKRSRAEMEGAEEDMFAGYGDDDEDDEYDDDEDFGGGGGGEDDELDFDELAAEQDEREEEARALKKHRAENPYRAEEKDRREIDMHIQKHRGLTKARPKDRKNPRANARRKFKVGLRVAKAQSRTVTGGAEREGNVALKTHVTHSTKLG